MIDLLCYEDFNQLASGIHMIFGELVSEFVFFKDPFDIHEFKST